MATTNDEYDPYAMETSARMPLWKKELIQRRKQLTKSMPINNSIDQHIVDDTTNMASHTSTHINDMMTNTTAVNSNSKTDTIEEVEDTYTTGHSHSEQFVQHQISSLQTTNATIQLPLPHLTNTTIKLATDSSSEKEIHFQLHSRHENERIASDNNDSECKTSLKKCTFNKNNNFVNKTAINSVNKFIKLSEKDNKKVTMVAMPELLSDNDNLDDDTSEELQYGPGIVSKLRCRYLSLALRQSTSKQRPSLDNLRRATSLNNLIDEEDEHNSATNRSAWNQQDRILQAKEQARTPDEYVSAFCNEHIEQNENRCRPNHRGNDSLKRARSVEALMRYDQNAWQRDINKDAIDQITDGNSFDEAINETKKINGAVDFITIEDKIFQARERGEHKPKRLTSFMDETERPPPDLVKHTLRIFEASANRRPRINIKKNGDVAAKVATFKTIISQEKPQIVFPKPPLSPKKPVIKPRTSSPKQIVNGNRFTNGTSIGNNKMPSIDINVAKSNFENPMLSPNSTKRSNESSRTPSPLTVRVDMAYRTNKLDSPLSPLQNNRQSNVSPLTLAYPPSPLPAPRPLPRQELPRNISDLIAQNHIVNDSPVTSLSKKIETLSIESPKNGTSQVNTSDFDSEEDESNVNSLDGNDFDEDNGTPTKRISKSALANISKAGETTEFNFFAQSTKSYLPIAPLNVNSSTPIKPNSCDTNEPNVRQIGIIRPQVKTNATSQPNIPSVNVNQVNNKKDIQSVVINETNGMLVDEKPNRDKLLITNLTSSSNMMLTTREIEQNLINKEKSDEIKWVTKGNSVPLMKPWQKQEQNNTMVFNFSNKKDVPDYIEKFENDGLVVRRKSNWTKPGESGFVVLGDLTVETSTDPDDLYPLGPPSPCDVEFENDNVIIDGKSSLKDKSIDRKLKIQFNETLTSIFEYPSESSLLADDSESSMVSGLLGNMALGSAPLGSYTPIKASINTSFELGITRTPSIEQSTNTITNGESSESLQYLKPATDEQTVAWSEGTRVTDLLF